MMTTRYLKVSVDGLNIFYREAGPVDAPVLLLLHGFPTAGHMFRNLIPMLSDRFRLIAPDLPGFDGKPVMMVISTDTWLVEEFVFPVDDSLVRSCRDALQFRTYAKVA